MVWRGREGLDEKACTLLCHEWWRWITHSHSARLFATSTFCHIRDSIQLDGRQSWNSNPSRGARQYHLNSYHLLYHPANDSNRVNLPYAYTPRPFLRTSHLRETETSMRVFESCFEFADEILLRSVIGEMKREETCTSGRQMRGRLLIVSLVHF